VNKGLAESAESAERFLNTDDTDGTDGLLLGSDYRFQELEDLNTISIAVILSEIL
jgi:hypothetical protein